MAKAKEVTITITDRLFTLELALEDFERQRPICASCPVSSWDYGKQRIS
jgi:hypothetical protein